MKSRLGEEVLMGMARPGQAKPSVQKEGQLSSFTASLSCAVHGVETAAPFKRLMRGMGSISGMGGECHATDQRCLASFRDNTDLT